MMAARQKTPENGMYHYVCWERRINHSEPWESEKKKRPMTDRLGAEIFSPPHSRR